MARTEMILGIDTSLSMLSAALVADGVTKGAVMVEGEGSRNEKLLPAIDWLLAESGVTKDMLSAVVVTRGPGSFTGVRIGIATAQGISFALRIPLVAMSTHEAVIESGALTTVVHGNAGRGEFYVSGFRNGEKELEPMLASAEYLSRLTSEFGSSLDADELSRDRNMALGACRRYLASKELGRDEGFGDSTPIYVRPSEAEARLKLREDEARR